ncbi:MAG TPA: heme lyase CcmF/NrfE family subunit [Candidatus Sulfotelmatobacter sp.]|nr:heme lyase CcmF/NrfE family subunit [Candidatus Sulfotelmatobacter sp.]
MIAEIGHFALIMALMIALVQGSLPLIGAARGNLPWMALGTTAACGSFVFIALSFGALTWAHVVSDFTVVNVVQNSNSAKPMLYKVAGVWGNHEGSMLLWVLILSVYGAAVALFGFNLPRGLKARVLAVQAWISIGFLLFILFTSNPFLRVIPAPPDGNGLNPLLQDPGLAFHPPFLYLGYVGFSMAFSFAIAALIEGRVDAAWARWVRPWALVAWCFLTTGIAMGSWWSYYVLGWGGWWFWDPVENASFMPWLAGTALLHSAIVVEKRDALRSWTILLAILTFSLSLLGTFLVRSGVLTSVHAFATDPARGVFILGFLVLVVGGSLTLYAVRAPSLKLGGLFAPISREGALILNNLLLATACATVLFGTLWPLIDDAAFGRKVSVGPPYFNLVFGALMVPLIVTMAIGPMMAWKRGDLAGALGRLKAAFVIAVIAVVGMWAIKTGNSLLPLLGVALVAWLLVGAIVELADRLRLFRAPLVESLGRARRLPRAAYGMTLAHMGVALTVLGITVSGTFQSDRLGIMRLGESAVVGPYKFTLVDVSPAQGPNYQAKRASIRVERGGALVAVMHPETRHYPVPPTDTTEVALRSSPIADLYAAIGDPDGKGGYAIRLYHKPMVSWIWLGAVVMVLGGALSLSDRRHRVGAPARKRTSADLAPAPAE